MVDGARNLHQYHPISLQNKYWVLACGVCVCRVCGVAFFVKIQRWLCKFTIEETLLLEYSCIFNMVDPRDHLMIGVPELSFGTEDGIHNIPVAGFRSAILEFTHSDHAQSPGIPSLVTIGYPIYQWSPIPRLLLRVGHNTLLRKSGNN